MFIICAAVFVVGGSLSIILLEAEIEPWAVINLQANKIHAIEDKQVKIAPKLKEIIVCGFKNNDINKKKHIFYF